MAENREGAHSFFQTVYEDSENFDTIRFMTEVEAQFKSDDLVDEVRWRLDVLNDITGQPGLEKVYFYLADQLLTPRYELHGFSMTDLVVGTVVSIDLRDHARAVMVDPELLVVQDWQAQLRLVSGSSSAPTFLTISPSDFITF